MALPSFTAAFQRVTTTMNNIWTPPWAGLSQLLFGPVDSNSNNNNNNTSSPSSSSSLRGRRSTSRRNRRSRSCPRVPAVIGSTIPPPHSYVFRSREDMDDNDSYPATFFFQSGLYDRPFGYSVLDRDRDGRRRSSCRRNRRSSCTHDEEREKNFLSALLSILVIATLATALTQPKWFSIRGGVCGRKVIGLQLFIEFGSQMSFHSPELKDPVAMPQSTVGFAAPLYPDSTQQGHESVPSHHNHNNYLSKSQASATTQTSADAVGYISRNRTLLNAIVSNKRKSHALSNETTSTGNGIRSQTPKKWAAGQQQLHVKKMCSFDEILPLQRGIVLFALLAIVANLVQFFLDTLGTSKKWLDSVRVHALGSIFGVICTIFVIGIAYMIATILEMNEKTLMTATTKDASEGSHLEIRFELSYYLVTLSGLIGLLAAACNMLRKPTLYFLSSASGSGRNLLFDVYPSSGLVEDDAHNPIWSGHSGSPLPPLLPPPPPYSP